MRALPLACLLTTVASFFAACGSSDDKKVSQSAEAGDAAGGSSGAASGASTGGAAPESFAGNAAAGKAAVGGTAGATGGVAGGTEGNLAGDGALAGNGGAGCQPVPSTLAGQLQGNWLICGALATNNRIWHALLTFDNSSCASAELSGTFHWLTTISGTSEGNTLFTGSHDPDTGLITLQEYEVTGGDVVAATDTFTYDPDSDTLVNGAWTCSCSPGSWTSATRVTGGTDVDACP